ncbi:MAG: ParB N-terminal domain-containing protein [Gallionellaceae bacterium]|nr:ParB N-terminal domain-containing protein [Gallionellaceae bacterium]
MTIVTNGIKSQRKLFHNEWLDVYPTSLPLSAIEFWKENNRTVFTFERLQIEKGKKLDELSIEEITEFIANQDIHKLDVLAKSIGRNGVQVPLIIRDDGKLLDGNRRYFACQWLQMQCNRQKEPLPQTLLNIPAYIIRENDLSSELELKILAEANFIPDLKVSWPLDAQARAVEEFYQERRQHDVDHESAIAEAMGVFGISRSRIIDFLDTLKLTKVFIGEAADEANRIARRIIVEEKFVYFWEFVNKAMKGRGAFDNPAELSEVRDMFFGLIGMGRDTPITGLKQVEPLVQAKRDETAWSMLKESKGDKLSVVVSMMNEKKEVRKDEDKIRIFLAWLKGAEELTPKAKSYLREVAALAAKKGQV